MTRSYNDQSHEKRVEDFYMLTPGENQEQAEDLLAAAIFNLLNFHDFDDEAIRRVGGYATRAWVPRVGGVDWKLFKEAFDELRDRDRGEK